DQHAVGGVCKSRRACGVGADVVSDHRIASRGCHSGEIDSVLRITRDDIARGYGQSSHCVIGDSKHADAVSVGLGRCAREVRANVAALQLVAANIYKLNPDQSEVVDDQSSNGRGSPSNFETDAVSRGAIELDYWRSAKPRLRGTVNGHRLG